MVSAYRAWLDKVTFVDPVERRQAVLVQSILVGLVIADAVSVIQTVLFRVEGLWLISTIVLCCALASASFALWLVRHGWLQRGVLSATLGMVLTIAFFAVLLGVLHNPVMLVAAMLPIAMSGLLAGRRVMLVVAGATVVMLSFIAAVESQPAPLFAVGMVEIDRIYMVIGTMVIVVSIMSLFYDRVRTTLHEALRESLAREQELERLRAGLEDAVQARTAELQTTVDQLQASQETIRELGAPVLPVLPGVLVAPLIGALDTARAADLSAAVLEAIGRTRARHLILDITGVPVVDTHVARALLRVAQAAQLLGAEVMLVGVRAEVAQTMVTLGVSLGDLTVFPNLQEAISARIGAA